MKKVLTLLFILASFQVALAQSPNSFKYQAVARNATGEVYANTNLSFQISILQGGATGTNVYTETHNLTSNDYGLVSMSIGSGTIVSGDFTIIDWGNDTYFVQVEMDPAGGSSFQLMGTSQLLSVPYALHARTASNVDDADADPANETITGAALNGTDLEITEAGSTTTVDLSTLGDDADADPANETITGATLNGTDLEITEAGNTSTVDLSSLVDDADASTTNETITAATLNGTDLEITEAGNTSTVDLSSLGDDADADPANETITAATLNGTDLEITEAGNTSTVDLSSLGDDADADPANETITAATLNGTDLEITEAGNTSTVDLSSLGDDADADPANETITAATLNGTDLEITEAGSTTTVDLSSLGDDADADATNETITAATLNGTDLEITEAGSTTTVDLSSLGDDADADATNETITAATLNGTDLEITEAGSTTTVDLSSLGDDADADATNETITAATLNGTDLEITEAGSTTTVDLSSLGDDADADATNEIQDLQLTGDNLTITNNTSPTTIDLSPYSNLWTQTASNIHRPMGTVGIGATSSDSRLYLRDTLTTTNRGAQFLVVGGSTANATYNGIFSEIKGTNGAQRAAEFRSNGNNGQFNHGVYSLALNGNQNIGVFANAGVDQGSTNSGLNYGSFSVAENSSSFNVGAVGKGGDQGSFNYGTYGFIESNSGNPNYGAAGYSYGAGAGKNYGVDAYAEGSTDTNFSIYSTAGTTGVSYAGYFIGNVTVTGNLDVQGNISKGGGTFKIDHPTDPENKYLVHSFVESPEMMNVYNGNTTTDAQGFATVTLPEYFESANKDFRYQLTVLGQFAQAIVKEKINGNKFIIQTNIPNVEVSWQVTGIRNDPYAQKNRIVPVQEKDGALKGKYLHPKAYDKSDAEGINHQPRKREQKGRIPSPTLK